MRFNRMGHPLLLAVGLQQETKSAEKTEIFRERTIQQAQTPRAAETPQDALVLVLNETGRVDLPRMEALLSRSPEEFLPELKGLLYRNPQTEQWETNDQYLSGEVRLKLENARAAAAKDASYQENVTAMEAVQPDDLNASDIDARLGAAWIPATDVEAFTRSLLGAEGVAVAHSAVVGRGWSSELSLHGRYLVTLSLDLACVDDDVRASAGGDLGARTGCQNSK